MSYCIVRFKIWGLALISLLFVPFPVFQGKFVSIFLETVYARIFKIGKRFGEPYRRTKKPKQCDIFLHQHFKRTGHSPNDISKQPVEKLTYR